MAGVPCPSTTSAATSLRRTEPSVDDVRDRRTVAGTGSVEDPSFAAARCEAPLCSSCLPRAATRRALRSSVPPEHPAASERPSGSDGAAPGPDHGRPRGRPCGDLTLAGSSHLGSGTFPVPRQWAGAHHLHLAASARSCRVAGGGSAVRSRPATCTLRTCLPCCPGCREKSQDGHRISTALPQDVPSSCPGRRTVRSSLRAVERLWKGCGQWVLDHHLAVRVVAAAQLEGA